MKKVNHTTTKWRCFLLLLAFLLPVFSVAENEVHIVPVVPLSKPVSGHYAGIVNGELWTWGGSDFPREPLAEGGKKKYYPQGDGASLSLPQGTLCIGGFIGEIPYSDVMLMKHIDHKDYKNFVSQYDHSGRVKKPALPVGIRDLAAAFDGQYVFALGGEVRDSVPNRTVYRMAWPDGTEWKLFSMMPDKARLQPVSVVQDTPEGPCLFLFGGYQRPSKNAAGFVHSDALKLNLRTKQWTKLEWNLPEGQDLPTVGATAACTGFGCIVFVGGVNKEIFEDAINQNPIDSTYFRHPVDWYRLQQNILVYNTFTDTWTTLKGDPSFARARATLTPDKNYFYLAGGETMPGFRTGDVSVIQFLQGHSMGLVPWVLVGLLLAALLYVGFRSARGQKNVEDFFLAKGRLPWWASGTSFFASVFSSSAFLAVLAAVYTEGILRYVLFLLALVVLPLISLVFCPAFSKQKNLTVYEYLGHRFNPAVRVLSAILYVLFALLRMAILLFVPSWALSAVTGVPVLVFLLLLGLVVTLCCVLGGLKAVAYNNVLLVFLFFVGAVATLVCLLRGTEGGFSGLISMAQEADKFQMPDFSLSLVRNTFWVILLGGLVRPFVAWSSDQSVAQHYLSSKDRETVRASLSWGGFLLIVLSLLAFLLGAAAFSFLKSNPSAVDLTLQKPSLILPHIATSAFPAGLKALFLLAFCALGMSTLGSQINALAAVLSTDFLRLHKREQTRVSSARVVSLVVGLVGVLLAFVVYRMEQSVVQQVLGITVEVFVAALGTAFFLGTCCSRVRGVAVLIGILVSIGVVVCCFVWPMFHSSLVGVAGLLAGVLAGLLLSLFGRHRGDI